MSTPGPAATAGGLHAAGAPPVGACQGGGTSARFFPCTCLSGGRRAVALKGCIQDERGRVLRRDAAWQVRRKVVRARVQRLGRRLSVCGHGRPSRGSAGAHRTRERVRSPAQNRCQATAGWRRAATLRTRAVKRRKRLVRRRLLHGQTHLHAPLLLHLAAARVDRASLRAFAARAVLERAPTSASLQRVKRRDVRAAPSVVVDGGAARDWLGGAPATPPAHACAQRGRRSPAEASTRRCARPARRAGRRVFAHDTQCTSRARSGTQLPSRLQPPDCRPTLLPAGRTAPAAAGAAPASRPTTGRAGASPSFPGGRKTGAAPRARPPAARARTASPLRTRRALHAGRRRRRRGSSAWRALRPCAARPALRADGRRAAPTRISSSASLALQQSMNRLVELIATSITVSAGDRRPWARARRAVGDRCGGGAIARAARREARLQRQQRRQVAVVHSARAELRANSGGGGSAADVVAPAQQSDAGGARARLQAPSRDGGLLDDEHVGQARQAGHH